MDSVLFIYTSLIEIFFPLCLELSLAFQVNCFESTTAHEKAMYDSRTDVLYSSGYFKLFLF